MSSSRKKRKRDEGLVANSSSTTSTATTQKVRSFLRVTPRSLGLFDKLHAEDKTNLTRTGRSVDSYNRRLLLKTGLVELIIDLANKLGRKVRLLDAGCGEGVAIDELLSDPRLKAVLENCTGVSLHYFTNIKTVMERHGHRFTYYLGKAQDVLASFHSQFDLIVDVWGAYLYTIDRMALLKLYHQALKPHARAYVLSGKSSMLAADLVADTEKDSIIKRMSAYFPETFAYVASSKREGVCIRMTKQSERFPVGHFDVVSYEEKPSVSHLGTQSLFKFQQGNAVYPAVVRMTPSDDPFPLLRRLKFE